MSVTQALTDSSSAHKESASNPSPQERTRLHITPFNSDLLKTFIPASVLPHATGISYHTVQTFPEKGFGYVEIPTMEAQKVKKKFNGSILRGQKVRIEDALPEKRKRVLEDIQADAATEEPDKKARKKAKKIKHKDGVLAGVELEGRNVKRGWTEPESTTKRKSKDKKEKDSKKHKSQPSKYTTEPEVLFKTKVPPNAAPLAKADKALEKPKKSKKSTREVVVHEFAKTTKHAAFLKSNQIPKDAKKAAGYVEGQGWVDEEGNLVEPESDKRRKRREAEAEAARKRAEFAAQKKISDSGTSKRKTALERAEELEARANASAAETGRQDISEDESDDASSVVSSSSSDVSSTSGDEASEESASEESSEAESDDISQQSGDGEAALQDDLDTEMADAKVEATDDAADAPTEVHPLEALFKRPKLPGADTPSKLAPINTSFSFFGGDADEEANEEQVNTAAPLTPYTRQDMQVRGVRSAAPTPDTAAAGKKFWRDEVEDDEEVEDSLIMHHDVNSVPVRPKPAAPQEEGVGEEEQSEFAKHFWEHRGEYNRAWKKRRRESMKAQRQRENKRLGRKVV
ncbi:hypothetical protein IWZ00DRAFT_212224 [Phyllosticta capitalensis]|uniref:Uncharacterized protein n=1 Tax=Phyllosticta capitalensis TaxID=121624 RepID=A0ABR1YSN3_9PEZI